MLLIHECSSYLEVLQLMQNKQCLWAEPVIPVLVFKLNVVSWKCSWWKQIHPRYIWSLYISLLTAAEQWKRTLWLCAHSRTLCKFFFRRGSPLCVTEGGAIIHHTRVLAHNEILFLSPALYRKGQRMRAIFFVQNNELCSSLLLAIFIQTYESILYHL